MALAAAGEAASLAWQLRGVAALGGAIGLGSLAGDMEVGALGLQAAAATPAVLAGLGGLYVGGKYIKSSMDAKQSQLEMPFLGLGKRKRTDERYIDRASYRQYSTTKRRYGRKVRAITRNMRLLKTVTEPIRYRFGTVKDQNAASGTYWLTNQPLSASQRVLPVYLTSLFNVRQGGAADNTADAARHMYELGNDTNGYFWRIVNGTDPLNTAATTNSVKQTVPSISTGDGPGRRGLIDWTRIRLCFWAKSSNPSSIRVSLIKFTDPQFCPETYDSGGAGPTTGYVTSTCAEWLTQKLKFLLNGHMGANPRFDRKKYVKVLKQWNLEMNPIDAAAETAVSDPRPHMKHLDIFNRWNRVNDYTDRELTDSQSYVNLVDINRASNPNDAFNGYLKNPEKGVYLMIESVQPVAETTAVADNPRVAPVVGNIPFAVSFDYLFEANYTVVSN